MSPIMFSQNNFKNYCSRAVPESHGFYYYYEIGVGIGIGVDQSQSIFGF